jgi:hypothetical protein
MSEISDAPTVIQSGIDGSFGQLEGIECAIQVGCIHELQMQRTQYTEDDFDAKMQRSQNLYWTMIYF